MFESTEEQLDLPTLTVGFGDNRSRRVLKVGPDSESTGVFSIVDGDAPQIDRAMVGSCYFGIL